MRLACALITTAAIATALLLSQVPSGGDAQPPQGGATSSPLIRVFSLTDVVYAEDRNQQGEGDDGPDVLLVALLTTGAAAGAGALGLVGYVIRNRVGFWLHRPPPRDGNPPDDHH